MATIVDTNAVVALADRKDPHREAVRDYIRWTRRPLIMPAPVSAEIDYLLTVRVGYHGSIAFLQDVANDVYRIEGLAQEEYDEVVRLSARYAALRPGLADLSVVVLAARFNTTRILTFDERHFRAMTPLQGGTFTLLPLDEDGAPDDA